MPSGLDTKHRLIEAARDLIWENSYGATSVDAICDRAGVKKGSFYHFFPSKSELAVAALDAEWEAHSVALKAIFASEVPPLQRLVNYFERVYERQVELKRQNGHVLGCPLCSLGCEVCNRDPAIRSKIQEIVEDYRGYFEAAIKEAHAAGEVGAPDAAFKSQVLFAYYQGTLVQARLSNDLTVLASLRRGALDILRARNRPMVKTMAA